MPRALALNAGPHGNGLPGDGHQRRAERRRRSPLVAKTAALKAEREAIDQALVRFRWNRRKAAAYLNVSYKTLLNKIKECGITASERS